MDVASLLLGIVIGITIWAVVALVHEYHNGKG